MSYIEGFGGFRNERRWSRWMLGAALLISFGRLAPAWALPMPVQAYRNDSLDVVVYRDSQEKNTFWYLPKVRILTDAGGKVVRQVEQVGEKHQYSFYVVPYFPDELADFVAGEIPEIRSKRDLKPVVAKKFTLQMTHFNLVAQSDEVADHQYLNKPQLVRLLLTPEQSKEFEELYLGDPGVPVNLVIHYDSDKISKFIEIRIAYSEVAQAMGLAALFSKIFTGSQIQQQVSTYLVSTNIHIRSMGDPKLPGMIDRVIQECFLPVDRNGRPGVGNTGFFVFKKERLRDNNRFVVLQQEVTEYTAIAVLPGYLSSRPKKVERIVFTAIPQLDAKVDYRATQGEPFRSGIFLRAGDQYAITAGFALSAERMYPAGVRSYRWEAAWGNTDGDLYYRVGTGPWIPVNGRTAVGTDTFHLGGELQFYLDRASVWTKLPLEKRGRSTVGLPWQFIYERFYPAFHVTVTGRRVEVQRWMLY